MPANPERRRGSVWLLVIAAAMSLCLGACSSVSDTARSTLSSMTPYKVEVVQGNFVSSEQVKALKIGMTRQQVRDILGTSLLTDVFHNDRWDYVFTIRRQGIDEQEKRVTVFFDGDSLARIEGGDSLFSEQDFVAKLDNHKRASGKVPALEASDDQLKKFNPPKDTQASAAPVAEPPPLPAVYPPLEPAH